VTRTPLALAAIASAAVPGLDPANVKGVTHRPGHQFEVAFVQDTQHRRWVVRAPMTAAAGAQMDVAVSLLGLFSRRLPFSVPMPEGFVALDEGVRAVVYPFMPGRPLDFAQLPGGPGIAADLGRALAALHNLDLALCEEAGLTSYDPDTYRTRRLADLDRAAATGQVPTGLLSRWERSLEDVSLWRFAPTPIHGDLNGSEVLAVFADDGDAATGQVRAVTGWENAKVADPADDFATLVTQASPAAFDSVLEAYAHARLDRPDKYLERRARLAGELKALSQLLTAVGTGNKGSIAACADRLRKLDTATVDTVDAEPVVPTLPTGRDATGSFAFTAHSRTSEQPQTSGAPNATKAPMAAQHADVAGRRNEDEPDGQDGAFEVAVGRDEPRAAVRESSDGH
jgi:macrolide phosphotransferase